MLRLVRPVLVVSAAALAVPEIAHADWIYRVGAASAVNDQSELGLAGGGELRIDDDGPVLAGDLTWVFTEHLGVELWISDVFNSGVSYRTAAGASGVDDVDYQCPTATLQWHFNPGGRIRPYLGAGMAYTIVDDSSQGRVDIDDDTGWTVGAGIDVGERRGGFLFNAYARYVDFSPTATVASGGGIPPAGAAGTKAFSGKWDISPMVYGVSVGYRFGREPGRPLDTIPPAPPPANVPAD